MLHDELISVLRDCGLGNTMLKQDDVQEVYFQLIIKQSLIWRCCMASERHFVLVGLQNSRSAPGQH